MTEIQVSPSDDNLQIEERLVSSVEVEHTPALEVVISDAGVQGPKGDTGEQGIQGIQGPKGDPGGWATSTVFGGNLNDLTTPGLYLMTSAAAANAANNAPTAAGGQVEVIAFSAAHEYVIQTFTVVNLNNPQQYHRSRSGGSWSVWFKHTTTGTNTFTSGQVIESTGSVLNTRLTGGTVNARDWSLAYNGDGSLSLHARSDAGSTQRQALRIYRNNNVQINNLFNIAGTGSPEGVQAAPVGSRYTDTDATNGAVEWIKATGSGPSGWKVVYGDTGWRNVESLLVDFQSVPGLPARIKRVGSTVSMSGLVDLKASSATNTKGDFKTVLVLPSGFVNTSYTPLGVAYVSGHVGMFGTVGGIGTVQVSAPSVNTQLWVEGDRVGFDATWQTDNPWPTYLPGTAA